MTTKYGEKSFGLFVYWKRFPRDFWGIFGRFENPETPMQDSCVTAYFYVSGTNSLVEIIRDSTSVMGDYAMLFVSLIPIQTPPCYGLPDRFLPLHYQDLGKTSSSDFSTASIEWGNVYIGKHIQI